MALATVKLSTILFALAQTLKYVARKHPEFRARLKERNLAAQILARDEGTGRWFRSATARSPRAPACMPSPTSS